MANHRAPRRRLFARKPAPLPATPPATDDDAALQAELDEFFEDVEPAPAAQPVTAPVARVVDLAERRTRPTGGADIVMMTHPATTAGVQAVYPDGSIEDIAVELRVVAVLERINDGMILNITGGGHSAAIAVTHSP